MHYPMIKKTKQWLFRKRVSDHWQINQLLQAMFFSFVLFFFLNKTFIIRETWNNICYFSMSQHNRNNCVYFIVVVKIIV